LVEEAGLLDKPEAVAAPSLPADAFTHTITVETGHRSTTVTATDTAVPDALQPLLAWLSRHARTSRPRAEEE
jgi:hypothetical protein